MKAYQLLGRTMRAAVSAGMIPASPCRDVRLPKVEGDERRYLTPAEVARLAGQIDERYRTLVLVGAYGGLRIGELIGLRRGRVDLLRGEVDVAEIIVEVRGRHHAGPPKTRAGRRRVSLPRAVVDELAAHLGPVGNADALVWPAPGGKGPVRLPTWRRRFWRPAVEAAGLDGLTPHGLRHTAVAFWIADGASPKQIANRARHTSVAVVLDRYGHLFDEHDQDLRDRLDARYAAGLAAAGGGEVVSLDERRR